MRKPLLVLGLATAMIPASWAAADCGQALAMLRDGLLNVEDNAETRPGAIVGADLAELRKLVSVAERFERSGERQMCGELVDHATQLLDSIREPRLADLDEVLGKRVRDAEGETIGRLRQLVFDPISGQIAYGIIGIGGFLGFAEELVVVPWGALRRDSKADRIVLPASAARLKQAPRHDDRTRAAMADRSWGLAVHKFFDVQPYWQRRGGVAAARLTTQQRRLAEALAEVPGSDASAKDATAGETAGQVERLGTGINRLEQRLDSLSSRINQLEESSAPVPSLPAAVESSGARP